MKKRRLDNDTNAGSMADIAFLLLIFFLVTTTIVQESGIAVKLPPWSPDEPSQRINDKNVFSVKVNANNQLLVESERLGITELRTRTKEFIMNPQQLATLPTHPTNAVISLQNDRSTSYDAYVEVYNELRGAYNELWEETAQKQYGIAYTELSKSTQKNIRKKIPLVISEAEPTEYEIIIK